MTGSIGMTILLSIAITSSLSNNTCCHAFTVDRSTSLLATRTSIVGAAAPPPALSTAIKQPSKQLFFQRHNDMEQQQNGLHGYITPSSRSSSPPKLTTTTTTTRRMGSMDPNVDPESLVCAKDDTTQQLAFVSILVGVVVGSFGFVALYDFAETILPVSIFQPFYTVLPYVLSSTFIAAGIAHFVLEETFVAFVPPLGTWGGLWQIPAPLSEKLGLTYGQYHSFWSGIAEVVVSSSLIATTAGVIDLGPIPAYLMYLLTLAVTPANIYMFTHNPDVPVIPPVTYPYAHGGRGVLQCALMGVFYKLAVHSS